MFPLLLLKKPTSQRASPWRPLPAPRRRGGSQASCSSLGGLRRPSFRWRGGERGNENEKKERQGRWTPGEDGSEDEGTTRLCFFFFFFTSCGTRSFSVFFFRQSSLASSRAEKEERERDIQDFGDDFGKKGESERHPFLFFCLQEKRRPCATTALTFLVLFFFFLLRLVSISSSFASFYSFSWRREYKFTYRAQQTPKVGGRNTKEVRKEQERESF